MALVAPTKVADSFAKRVAEIVGPDRVSQKDSVRTLYSRDMWPKTLLWTSDGRFPHPPDLVAWPADTAEVSALVRLCGESGVPIVPFGAGSGVCGGAVPIHGGLTIDLKRMNQLVSLDPVSGLAEADCGIIGQHLEDELEKRGFTMGHFPSSIYCSTLGGFLAARSAGQLSTRYGKAEDMVSSFIAVTGTGDVLDTAHIPELNQALVGSEGTLAIITRARMRVHPQAEARRLRGYTFPTMEDGLEAIRVTLQRGARPAVVRLYDPLDTFLVGSKKSGGGFSPLGFAKKLIDQQLPFLTESATRAALGRPGPIMSLADRLMRRTLLIFGFEGARDIVEAESQIAHETALSRNARDDGEAPGQRWLENRYHVSYRQSKLFMSGCFVDTMEVATTWDRLLDLYNTVRSALRERALVMAHFSHAYPEGCSIYFTFAGTGPNVEAREALYDALWRDGLAAVQSVGGCLSHHHGVGLSKASFMNAELGEGMRLYRALKDVFDPRGVLNPGKMGL